MDFFNFSSVKQLKLQFTLVLSHSLKFYVLFILKVNIFK